MLKNIRTVYYANMKTVIGNDVFSIKIFDGDIIEIRGNIENNIILQFIILIKRNNKIENKKLLIDRYVEHNLENKNKAINEFGIINIEEYLLIINQRMGNYIGQNKLKNMHQNKN